MILNITSHDLGAETLTVQGEQRRPEEDGGGLEDGIDGSIKGNEGGSMRRIAVGTGEDGGG